MDFSQFSLESTGSSKKVNSAVHIVPQEHRLSSIRARHEKELNAFMACSVIKAGELLVKTRLFTQPAEYRDIASVYSQSYASRIEDVLTLPDPNDDNVVYVYYKVAHVWMMNPISLRDLVGNDPELTKDIKEVRRWYLYVMNCLTWFKQATTLFVNIDSDEKIQKARDRVASGKFDLPSNEFVYMGMTLSKLEIGEIFSSSKLLGVSAIGKTSVVGTKEIPTSLEFPEVDMDGIEDRLYNLFVYLTETQSLIGIDVETTGLDTLTTELVSFGIGVDTKIGFYVSTAHGIPKTKALYIGEKGVIRHIANMKLYGHPIKNSTRYLNMCGSNANNITSACLRDIISRLKQKKLILHNAKFDYGVLLSQTGIRLPVFMDTMLAHYISRPGYDDLSRDKRGLKHIVVQELGVPSWKVDLKQYKLEHKDLAAAYNVRDICYMLGMAFIMEFSLRKIWPLFEIEMNFLPVLIHAERTGICLDVKKLKQIETDLKFKMEDIVSEFSRMYKEGETFNINSGPMIKDLFFNRMGVVPIRKCTACSKRHQHPDTKCHNEDCELFGVEGSTVLQYATPAGEASLDKHALGALAKAGVTQAKRLMEYRAASKLVTSYTNLDTKLHPMDGMLHPTYNQARTATGRLSSSNPNFQQLPKKAGKYIRGCIVPKPKHCLIAADYAGQEIRILAAYSKDEKLIKAYNPCFKCVYNNDPDWRNQFGKCEKESHKTGSVCNVVDIHSYITKQIHGDAIDVDVSLIKDHPVYDRLRTIAKSVTFALAYGGSAYGIAETNGIPFEEAQSILDQYFDTFPGVKAYILSCQIYVDKYGKITDMVGRTRRFKYAGYLNKEKEEGFYERYYFSDGLRGVNKQFGSWVRKDRRAATNFPVQSLAASMTKVAAIELDRAILESGIDAQIVQFIHDELLLTCIRSRSEVEKMLEMVNNSMTAKVEMARFNFPNHPLGWAWPPYLDMEADISIGDSYGSMMKPKEYLKVFDEVDEVVVHKTAEVDLVDAHDVV